MGKKKITICVLGFFVTFYCISSAWSDPAPQASWGGNGLPPEQQMASKFVPGELLVKFKKGTGQVTITALYSKFSARELSRIQRMGVSRIKLPPDISVPEVVEQYNMDPRVEYAEPNYILHFTAMPNDPDLGELWGLHNTGQQVNGMAGTQDADIDALEAWEITTGSIDVIIAVLDSGVTRSHPEINPNIWINSVELNGAAGVDDDNNGYIDDIYGWDFWNNDNSLEDCNSHGTHVAGTIAALGNNGAAITGVNWSARIMSLRIGGVIGTISDATNAINYAVDNGADIINASWNHAFSSTIYEAISYANDNGVLFVTGAGNGGDDGVGDDNDVGPIYPSGYDLPNIIAVAATDQDDNLAGFSNYGAASVDVAAPGTNIYSTVPELTPGAREILYTEDFDPPPSGWVGGGINFSWAFSDGTGEGESYALEDSPGGDYLNDTYSVVGFAGSGTPISSVKDNYYTLSFRRNSELESGSDYLFLAGSENGTIWFLPDASFFLGNARTGSTSGFISDSFDLTVMADLMPAFYFGYCLYTNGSITQDGVYIDNLQLYREPIVVESYGYSYKSGTSMASPHVAGIAGLVKAQNPDYTHIQIIDAIFNTVDNLSSLSGRLSTGGRVNAFEAVTYIAPPPNFSVIAGDGSVALNWDANCESAVTGYIVSYGETTSLGTEINAGDVTAYLVGGLSNGTTYYFRVRAMGDFPIIGSLDGTYSDMLPGTPDVPDDLDGDGVGGNLDNCPNTFNPDQADSDGDGFGDVCDGCPDDADKTELGSCGCGNPDTDSDGDGTADCIDGCPADDSKTEPGGCGCGEADIDSDLDEMPDCEDTNDDNDSLPDAEEQGISGDAPNYDGNGDGVADRLQANVASFHTYDGRSYVTLEASAGTTISNCKAVDNPSPSNAPSNIEFSYGFFEFAVEGVTNGGATTVLFHFPAGIIFDTYYNFGSTTNNTTNHWYEFIYDSRTGAEIDSNVIRLHFLDGGRGDDDLTANGIAIGIGAPANTVIDPAGDGDGTTQSTGGGGGGCFLRSLSQ